MTPRLAVLAALALVACKSSDAPRSAPATPDRPDQVIGGTVVPQSHEFPAGRAADIRRIFEEHAMSYPIAVMSTEGVQTQFVNPKPVFIGDRRFVVGLPPAHHVALDKLIARLGSGPAINSTYELTYWVVEGAAAPETEVPSDLADIAPVLAKLSGLGKRRFKSIDRIDGRLRDGAYVKQTGRTIKTEHRLMAGPDGVELEVKLELTAASDNPDAAPPSMETMLNLPFDRPIVLGDAQASTTDGASNLLLYVVRARRVD